MTEWDKYKVAELKEECKSRQISLTGLKLKQQYIDKLVEYESSNAQDAAPAEESVAERTNGAFEEVAKDEKPDKTTEPEKVVQDDTDEGDSKDHQEAGVIEDIPLAVEADEALPDDRPTILRAEDNQGLAAEAEAKAEGAVHTAGAGGEPEDGKEEDVPMPDSEQLGPNLDPRPDPAKRDRAMGGPTEKLKETQQDVAPTPIPVADSMEQGQERQESKSSSEEESRKRKRRSVTPPPDAEEVQKKVKVADGGAVPAERLSRSSSPKSPKPEARTAAEMDMPEATTTEDVAMEESVTQEALQPDNSKQERAEKGVHARERELSMDKEETVEPAMHAATRSLYMRNFKRPLNVQTLRAHIVNIAQGPSSVAPDSAPINFFNVNNIRSHAFVTFTSISAASRVRAAMHQTRFPDEPQRDPLWIDFVPDEKVQEWVEQETGGSRALGRNSSAKLEVVYNQTDDGVEAVFQEVDTFDPRRASMGAPTNQRSSLSHRQASYSADTSRISAIASGIHADRATLVPQSPRDRRRSSPARQAVPAPQKPRDEGIGFKGLDDLFESTQVKPKLYYKLQPQSVIDDRLDMIKDLYSDRGVSGDPGMKRYTFEKNGGRDGWVDNGPEFGHGKRGADRLAGVGGRGRGGFRGRGGGGGRGFYGGDSYRGGGRR
ncbi:hypothetical protein LTR70_005709 [Exophiala xenobiotica]|uniref:SAP domain-containing protein n=1 Tax=Lithohypha guttulata TaxID=1690604 RepID=A0ABR0KD35_9EURO|nr:hypothetical protein LTR24_004092 [Lithohypha guttulata]KAK5317704.1 hypothetical protein LTR70_005709 [Exophiala xenobiotica]